MSIAFQIKRALFHSGRLLEKVLHTFLSITINSDECVLCGSFAGSADLCSSCRMLLDKEAERALSDGKRCSHCGRPLLSEHEVCTSCRENPLFSELDSVFPLFTYVLSKKKLLYSWKIAGRRNLGEVFARYVAAVIKNRFPDAAVVPVPPRPGKIKKNGWDQIEDIASSLEYVHHIRVERLLKRTEGQQQKKLTKEERSFHSKHAYILDEKKVSKLKKALPSHLVLLDDVITTGSTIRACAVLLKNAVGSEKKEYEAFVQVEKVSAVSLFIVPG